jgi:tetratricopeptide (TPR) repeat protein
MLLLALSPAIASTDEDLSEALRRADHDTAIKIFTQYLNEEGRTPNNKSTLYNYRGVEYACNGQFDLAMHDYDQAIKLWPESALAFNNRGLTYQQMGQLDFAIQDFEQVIKLTPKNTTGYKSLAMLYASGRDEEFLDGKKAIQYAEKAVALEKNIDTMNTLAAAQARGNRFREATETQTEVLRLLKTKKNVAPEMLKEIEERIVLYQSGKPYTLPPLTFNRMVYKKRIRQQNLKTSQ